MKKLLLIALVMLIGACGMNRPFPPTIQYINGNASAAMPYGAQSSGYVMVYNLADAQLNWDVSNVPGADSVKIIAARDYNCTQEVASNFLGVVNSKQRSAVLYGGSINPLENLYTLFAGQQSKFTAGRYFLCVAAVKMGQVSPPSFPVTMEVMQNQVFLKVEGAGSDESADNSANENEEQKDKDPYADVRL